MRNKVIAFSAMITVMTVLAPGPVSAAEYTIPITWNAHAWMLRFVPHNEQFYLDGGIEATIDYLHADGESLDWSLYLGAGLDAGMGTEGEEQIFFDPNEAHYSLIVGSRFELGGQIAALEFIHDCFHAIDRYEQKGAIWNAVKTDLFSRGWYPRYRREGWRSKKGSGLILEADWMVTFWFFPRWKIQRYPQSGHDFKIAAGGGLKLAFAHLGSMAVELRPDLLYFLDRGGDWTWKNDLRFNLSWYGQNGTGALFAGRRWDSQRIKPSGDRWLLGFEFYL